MSWPTIAAMLVFCSTIFLLQALVKIYTISMWFIKSDVESTNCNLWIFPHTAIVFVFIQPAFKQLIFACTSKWFRMYESFFFNVKYCLAYWIKYVLCYLQSKLQWLWVIFFLSKSCVVIKVLCCYQSRVLLSCMVLLGNISFDIQS